MKECSFKKRFVYLKDGVIKREGFPTHWFTPQIPTQPGLARLKPGAQNALRVSHVRAGLKHSGHLALLLQVH